MKKYTHLILIILPGILSGCGPGPDGYDGETLIIHEEYWAVKELDPPYTVGDAKKRYGEPDEILKHEHSSEMVYSNSGISFVIYSESDDDSGIWDMIVYPPFKLRTEDGIELGKSTPREVKALWGKISWYGRGDIPGYWFFRKDAVRFLVPRDPSLPEYPLVEEAHLDRPVTRMIMPYSSLKRLQYEPPKPVEIKADSRALKKKTARDLEAYLKQAFVEKLDLDLDAHQDPDWNPLWDHFANRPYESQFTALTTDDWFNKRGRFEAALLSRADEQRLDRSGLQQIFDSIRPAADDRTAQIPVCAFLAKKGGEDVWIIVTKWEYADMGADGHTSGLGHIRVQAFRISDGQLVDAVQCS